MNSRNFKESQILEAIKNSGGIKLETARKLNCSRDTLNSYLKKYPNCMKAIETERENVIDIAEATLIKRIKEGSDTLLIFFLKTKPGMIRRTCGTVSGWKCSNR